MNLTRFLEATLLALVCSASSISAATSSCAKLIPPGGAYDIVRSSSKEDLHDYLDDRMYQKNYGTHNEAIADGFSVGAIVYGVPIKADGTWTKAWN